MDTLLFAKISSVVAGLALLSACNGDVNHQSEGVVTALDVGGKPVRCVSRGHTNIPSYGTQLTGSLRQKFLTKEAQEADIRVWVTDHGHNAYGSVTITYTDSYDKCAVWSEVLTLQEYSVRLGLNPIGISPHYQVENK